MTYKILYARLAEKFLRKAHPEITKHIIEKINTLQEIPVPGDAIKLQGLLGEHFRCRAGKYRILYEIDYHAKTIHVAKISRRESAY